MLSRLSSHLPRTAYLRSSAARASAVSAKAARGAGKVPATWHAPASSRSLASSSLAKASYYSRSALASTANSRAYATAAEIASSQLETALEEYVSQSTLQLDQSILQDLLSRNGWELEVEGQTVLLKQQFQDADVVIEVIADPPAEATAEARQLAEEAGGHHEHTSEQDNLLHSQMDFFNIVVSKKKQNERGNRLIFSCQALHGVLEVNHVTFTHPSYSHSAAILDSFKTGPNAHLNKSMSFRELPDELQASFENYLQAHGVNQDLALIIYYSLYKFDVNHEQEWAMQAQNFLRAH